VSGGDGSTPSSSRPQAINIHVDFRGSVVRSDEDIQQLATRLEKYLGRVFRGQ
jgi:hypothetical protein